MDAVDRTDELIAAMLARRSSQPVPPSLLDRTLAATAIEPQTPRRRPRRVAGPAAIDTRLAIAGAAALLLVSLAVAGVWTGVVAWPREPAPSQAVVVGPASPSVPAPTPDQPSPTPAPSADRGETPTPRSPIVFAPDTVAIVTQKGFDLRVRSAPGLGRDSIELWPLLASGTRLLVIGGPVRADGYDWYEVSVEGQPNAMYGWMSAAARDGTRWIRLTSPTCPATPSRRDVADMAPFDFLVCFHGRELTVKARISEGQRGTDSGCPLLDRPRCEVAEGWLLKGTAFTFTASDGKRRTVELAVPATLQSSLDRVPDGATMLLTIAMDAPEARSCRITDPATGNDLVPPNQVITACRLAFVLRGVELAP